MPTFVLALGWGSGTEPEGRQVDIHMCHRLIWVASTWNGGTRQLLFVLTF